MKQNKKNIQPYIIVLLCVLGITGCSTGFETTTWKNPGATPDEPVAKTRVHHYMNVFGLQIPSLIPMDAVFSDGSFVVETKAINLPTVDIGTLFKNDD